MQLSKPTAEIYVPDGAPVEQAVARATHLAIAAHPDDIEILAYDGIEKCFHARDRAFMGAILTDGAGTYREYEYASFTDEEMGRMRKLEQKKAAVVGEYCAVAMLDYTSAEVKDPYNTAPLQDIRALVEGARPQVIYTHNLTDRHDTHVATALRVIHALRSLPPEMHPQGFYGCEVWRDLDWMADEDKVVMTVDGHPNIAAALLGVHDTQNSGGKRIDLATLGRRQAHASYNSSHAVDRASAMILAMDLSPLIKNPQLDPAEFASGLIGHFHAEVIARIHRVGER